MIFISFHSCLSTPLCGYILVYSVSPLLWTFGLLPSPLLLQIVLQWTALFIFLYFCLCIVRLLEMGLLGQYLASSLQKRLANFPPREMYNFAFPSAEQKCLFSHSLAKSVCGQTFFFLNVVNKNWYLSEVWNYISIIGNAELFVGHFNLPINCFLICFDNIRSLVFSSQILKAVHILSIFTLRDVSCTYFSYFVICFLFTFFTMPSPCKGFCSLIFDINFISPFSFCVWILSHGHEIFPHSYSNSLMFSSHSCRVSFDAISDTVGVYPIL